MDDANIFLAEARRRHEGARQEADAPVLGAPRLTRALWCVLLVLLGSLGAAGVWLAAVRAP